MSRAALDQTRDGRYGVQQRNSVTGNWASCTINCGYDDLEGLLRSFEGRDDFRAVDRRNGCEVVEA